MAEQTFVALLRGINVGGHHRIVMAELCSLCAAIGWRDVRSHIQSGNLVFRGDGVPLDQARELEQAIARRFGFEVPVIVRSGADWQACLAGNPFPEAARKEPSRLLLALARGSLAEDAAVGLQAAATAGERVARVGDALWIHYREGIARSKLSPDLLDRLAGSPVTARNWRTAQKLAELAGRVEPVI